MQYFPQVILKFIGKSTKIIIFLSSSNILEKFSASFSRFSQNFSKNLQKLHREFPGMSKIASYFSQNFPPISSKQFSNLKKIVKNFFSFFMCYLSPNFISAKFFPIFLKTIAKNFFIPKFHQKLRNTNFCTPKFLHSFFKMSSQLIII